MKACLRQSQVSAKVKAYLGDNYAGT